MRSTDQALVQPGIASEPVTVHLIPEFTNKFCAHLQKLGIFDPKPARHQAGLLFGTLDGKSITIQEFRPLPVATAKSSPASPKARDSQNIRALAAQHKKDPELASCQVVGWYDVRALNAELTIEDFDFHNENFSDRFTVALIARPEQPPSDAVFEIYAGSWGKPLSREFHDCQSVHLNLAEHKQLTESIGLSLVPRINDDDFQRVYQILQSAEEELDAEEEKQTWWQRLSARCLPGKQEPADRYEDIEQREEPPAAFASYGRVGLVLSLLFVMTIGGAFLGLRKAHKGTAPAKMEPAAAASPAKIELGLRVESQGDRLLVKWNRNLPLTQSSKGGLLMIDDGKRHRQVFLDANQVASGMLSYRPATDDIVFLLEVLDPHEAVVTERIRVLDGTSRVSAKKNADIKGTLPFERLPVIDQVLAGIQAPKSAEAVLSGIAGQAQPSQVKPLEAAPQLSLPDSTPTAGVPAINTPAMDAAAYPIQSEAAPLPAPPAAANNGTSPPDGPQTQENEAAKSTPVEPDQSFLPPKAVKQVMPNTKAYGVSDVYSAAEIKIKVTIDAGGTVRKAELISNGLRANGIYAAASLAAARQWVFKPAMLHGIAVPAEQTLVFRFLPRTR